MDAATYTALANTMINEAAKALHNGNKESHARHMKLAYYYSDKATEKWEQEGA